MKIGSREIGNGAPCLVVAEVGLAHDGSLGMAHAYIDAVAKAGAGAVKFQHHRPEEGGRWRTGPPPWSPDVTRADYWRRTAFDDTEWVELTLHARERGLLFLCSTFSREGAEAMEPLLPAWKVASGQVKNGRMLDYMRSFPRPTIVSTGMAGREWWSAVGRFKDAVVLHSTSLYPTPLEAEGLDLDWRKGYYNIMWDEVSPLGLSDHSGTIWPSLAAATMGAALVEVHVTMSRDAYGPDTASSITIEELRTLCQGIEAIRLAQQPVDREALLRGPLAEARRVYMGVVA